MSSTNVVVVGGGVVGLSIAWALTKRGVNDVVVFERATLGSGGTGKSSGVVRCHYGVPSLAAMARKSLPVFEQAAEIFGTDIGFHPIGYLVGVAPENVEALRANIAMHQGLGIDVDLIAADTAQQMWPYADLADFEAFAYEPRGGYGDGPQTALAYAGQVRAGGAMIRQGTAVASLRRRGDRIAGVRLAGGETVDAAAVIIAAGAWSKALLGPIGVAFPVRSERCEVLLVDAGELLPELPVFSDLVSLQYVRTEASGQLLVGNSDHSRPEYTDPDHYSNQASRAGLERAVVKVTHRFPKLPSPRVSSTYAGCYDVTPDYNPVIAPAGPDGLYLGAGFSGHGFKISPAVGELMADLVVDGRCSDPHIHAADFRLERFTKRQPLTSPHPYVGADGMR
jgi:sarcosine oxidase, subunit beta